ncbi:MAG: enolase C-terminal domain-like protein, partial [Myxococcota bacterium]
NPRLGKHHRALSRSSCRRRAAVRKPVARERSAEKSGFEHRNVDRIRVDVAVLKPAFLGGPFACYVLAKRAQRRGLRTIVTHALGSIIERSAALHVAAALRCESPCGLGHPFREDLGPGFAVVGGRAYLPKVSGLGIQLNNQRMKAS